MKTYVAYLRVSTTKQGIDGLGMDAQEQAIKAYNGNVIAKFIEVESGKRKDRPELMKALDHCKLTGSTLIVAKLDRLARNLHFITSLMESKIPFVACDYPEANELTIHIMAAVAQHEAKAISARTKAALAEKKKWYKEHEEELKAQGLKYRLGNPNLTSEDRSIGTSSGIQAVKEKAQKDAEKVLPTILALQGKGLSLRGVAAELNAMSVKTPRGKQWTAMAVKNALDRQHT